MDAITHTVLALGSLAGAWYGGRWLLMREARRMWDHIATPEMKREIQLMDALIKHMSQEDDQHIRDQGLSEPLQLELFKEYGEYGYSPSE